LSLPVSAYLRNLHQHYGGKRDYKVVNFIFLSWESGCGKVCGKENSKLKNNKNIRMWGQAIVYIYQMGCDTPKALSSAYRSDFLIVEDAKPEK
jgi:hypothetical protein